MAKSSVLDDFTYEASTEPCTVVKAVTEHGSDLTQAFEHGVEQVMDHRRRKGSRATNGPTATWLNERLAAKGVELEIQVLRRHLQRRCSCYRGAA